jgi:hypothetical protein
VDLDLSRSDVTDVPALLPCTVVGRSAAPQPGEGAGRVEHSVGGRDSA